MSEGWPSKEMFTNLRWRYLMALSAIALTVLISQGILQYYIAQQKNDSLEVNLSGRQRMLSQRISKSAVLLVHPAHPDSVAAYRKELASSLGEWTYAHNALQHGDKDSGLEGVKHPEVQRYFTQIESEFQEIVAAATVLLDAGADRQKFAESLEVILQNEKTFVEAMDQIVNLIEHEARKKVDRLRRTELLLLIVALLLIGLELKYIFWPSAQIVKQNFATLAAKESKARKMAMEIAALYESLEKSYLELAEAETEVADLTIYGRCNPEGDFLNISDSFSHVMTFGQKQPLNLFRWLEEQGYDGKFVQRIRDLLGEGITWEGELKLLSEDGDFVWLKLHVVPVLGGDEAIAGLLMIAVDVTEVKEAQARSQEMHKEKMEKRLKEQQYRSALILEGQEEERRRISRDLHDGIGQYLSALKFSLDGITDVKTFPEEKRLEASKRLIKDVIKEVRRISFHLTPVVLSDYGLAPVLNKFAEEMSKISKIPVVFENKTGFLSRLAVQTENNVYRIVQEAVNNAIKYSKATEIKITLTHNAKYLNLEIFDDGVGFDYKTLKNKGHFEATGHGIFNIRERVNFINGQFTLETAPGAGTRIQVELPIET